MSVRNRELSQFGSFIYIDDPTRKIAITTESTPFVGIGTTNPQTKLHVLGDVKIDGNLEFSGELELGDVNLNTTGIITAFAFYNTLNQQLTGFDSWSQDGDDIYRLVGDIGVGTSDISEKVTIHGNVSAGRFISTVASGTAPLEVTSTTEVANLNASLLRGGIPGSNLNSFDIVTLGDAQSLERKTLVSPTFTGTGVTFNGSSSGRVTLRADASPGTPVVILPSTNGTLVSTGDTGVVTSNMIADLNITNDDVAVGAGISYNKLTLTGSLTNNDIANNAGIAVSKLSASTISGVTLGGSLNNLTSGSFINFNSGTTYNGSAARTISVAATTANTGNTIVARNSSGDFTAGSVNVTNLTASQTTQANNLTALNVVTSVGGNFSGIVTASSFSGTTGSFSGSVTSASFVGSGIGLTNIQVSSLINGPAGSIVGTAATQTLTNKTFGNFTETVFTITDGATVNLDPNNGPIQTWTLGASRTPGQANWAAGQSITLLVDDGSAYSITWSTLSVVWKTDGGVAPTLNTSGFTVIILWKVGATIYGARVGDA